MPFKYDYGDVVLLSVRFTDVNGVPADPTTITFMTLSPTNVRASYVYGSSAVVKDGTGLYHLTINPTQEGTWSWRAEGMGTVADAFEGRFHVNDSAFY